MTCPFCKSEVPDGAHYCPRCQNLLGRDTPAGARSAPRPSLPRVLENRESRNPIAALFARYFDFQGRSSRREFWLIALCWLGVAVIPAQIVGWIAYSADSHFDYFWIGWSIAFGSYTASTLIPGIAALVRRFHDTGHSGKTAWLFFTGVCTAWVIYLLCSPSQPFANKYGNVPTHPPGTPKPPKPPTPTKEKNPGKATSPGFGMASRRARSWIARGAKAAWRWIVYAAQWLWERTTRVCEDTAHSVKTALRWLANWTGQLLRRIEPKMKAFIERNKK